MSETDVFLRWDGECLPPGGTPDPRRWRNATAVGPRGRSSPPVQEREREASVTHAVDGSSGATLVNQRATVRVVSVSPYFAPGQEWAVIHLRIRQIERVGNLVLQIRDASGALVYTERLVRRQVWALPTDRASALRTAPPLAVSDADRPEDNFDRRHERAGRAWASVGNSPYTVDVMLGADPVVGPDDTLDPGADSFVNAEPGLARDPAGLQATGDGVVRSPPYADTGGPLTPGQTSVRVHSIGPLELVDPARLYEEIAFEPFPDDPAAIGDGHGLVAAEKQLLWVKCRLTQIGFHAGPIDLRTDDPDFERALRRYRIMRRIDGAQMFEVASNFAEEPRRSTRWAADRRYDPSGLAALWTHLAREAPVATALCSDAAAVQDAARDVRLYVDANRFYTYSDEFGDNKKAEHDADWISRPCLPTRARVLFERRDGAGDGSEGDGIEVPEVAARVPLQWYWKARDEDHGLLPSPARCRSSDFERTFAYTTDSTRVYQDANQCSRAAGYVQAAQAAVAGMRASDCSNCPQPLGGIVYTDPRRNAREPFASVDLTGHGWSPDGSLDDGDVVEDTRRSTSRLSVTVRGPWVYLRPSIIAGDNYRLAVEIAPDKLGDVASEPANRLHAGKSLARESACLTVWRRIRVAGVVEWPAQTATWSGGVFDGDGVWDAVRQEFAFAYTELPASAELRRIPVSDLSDLSFDGELFRTIVPRLLGLSAGMSETHERLGTTFTYSETEVYQPGVVPKPLTVATGNLPSVAAVFDALFAGEIGKLLHTIAANRRDPAWFEPPPPSGIRMAVMVKRRNHFFSSLLDLLRLYARYAPGPADSASVGQLKDMIAATARAITSDLDRVIEPLSGVPLDQAQFQWRWRGANGGSGDPLAAFVEDSVAQDRVAGIPAYRKPTGGKYYVDIRYADSGEPTLRDACTLDYDFAALMDLLFLPAEVSTELAHWAAGRIGTDQMPVTGLCAAVFVPLKGRLSGDPPAPLVNTYSALRHFWSAYKEMFDGNRFALKRGISPMKIPRCPIDPVAQEKRTLQIALGSAMTSFFPRFAPVLDGLVRAQLGCEMDQGKYKSLADGAIILSCRLQNGVQVGDADYVPFGASMGAPHGLVVLSQLTPMEPYALWAHELGHTLFMQHFCNAGTYYLDHDQADTNCVMSYPLLNVPRLTRFGDCRDPGYAYERRFLDGEQTEGRANWADVVLIVERLRQGVQRNTVTPETNERLLEMATVEQPRSYANGCPRKCVQENGIARIMRPHFCGKCNLKLRGWNTIATHPLTGDTVSYVLPMDSFASGEQLPRQWPEASYPEPDPASAGATAPATASAGPSTSPPGTATTPSATTPPTNPQNVTS